MNRFTRLLHRSLPVQHSNAPRLLGFTHSTLPFSSQHPLSRNGWRFCSTSTLHGDDMAAIIDNAMATKVRTALLALKRVSVSKEEYLKVTEAFGVGPEDAEKLLQSLHGAGVVLYLPNASDMSLKNQVVLRTGGLASAFAKELDLSVEKNLEAEIAEMQEELEPLEPLLNRVDRSSRVYANLVVWSGLSVLISQFFVFAYLTWGSLSWDIMEPVTYFFGQFNIILGYIYFLMLKKDHTYEEMWTSMMSRRRSKLLTKMGLDPERVMNLRDGINKRQALLKGAAYDETKTL